MTTIAQRMRAAADDIHRRGTSSIGTVMDHVLGLRLRDEAAQLRADADAIEAVEREMRKPFALPSRVFKDRDDWADRLRGEKP